MKINNIELHNTAVPYLGTIKETNDTGVVIQIQGRLGVMSLPWRQVLSDGIPKVGDRVKFTMSLIEMYDEKEGK